jgi:hypothetical protein
MRCRGLNHQPSTINHQPSASGNEIVLRPLTGSLPAYSIRWRTFPQLRENRLDRARIGDVCDHPQRAAAQRADRNIDIKYTLKLLCCLMSSC